MTFARSSRLTYKPLAVGLRGFTLIELLVTIAIAAVLATLAAPSIQEGLVKSRMNSVGGQFTNNVLRARNEAVNRNSCTVMCMSNNTTAAIVTNAAGAVTAGPRCVNSGNDWQMGWIVFLHESCVVGNQVVNSRPARPEDYIAIRNPVDNKIFFNGQNANRKIMFNALGMTNLANAGSLNLVYDTTGHPYTTKFGYKICLDKLGRTRSIDVGATCL